MNIRTDLAMEAREALGGDAPRGVTQQIFQRNGFCLTRVEIQTKEGAEILGKPVGTYTTIEHASLCNADDAQRDVCAALLTQELRAMLPENVDRGCVLVVGLGNRRVTPDSLGPCAAGQVFVTRHMIEALQITSLEGVPLQNVCSLSPGVLGVTGIETELVVKSLCRTLRPSCVICIDSLASMKTSRLLSTVQLSDSGISPGSGVGNHNAALDSDSLGVPVIAVGVPTVVYASVIVRDAGADHLALSREDDMLVTPRNIDEATEILSSIIARGINMALQPRLDPSLMQM